MANAQKEEDICTDLKIDATTALSWTTKKRSQDKQREISQALRRIEEEIKEATDDGNYSLVLYSGSDIPNMAIPHVMRQLKQKGFDVYKMPKSKNSDNKRQYIISWSITGP